MVFGIFAALAEYERELIRERTVAGLAAARARGPKVADLPKWIKQHLLLQWGVVSLLQTLWLKGILGVSVANGHT